MAPTLCIAAIVFEMAAAMRLLWTSRRYVFAAALLFADGIEGAGALYLPLSSIAYMWFWIAMQPCKAILLLLACGELIARIPEHYGPSIRDVGRRKLWLAIQAAAAITVITSLVDASITRGPGRPVLSAAVAGSRMCYTLAGIVLVLIARDVWLSRVGIGRNVIRHAALFCLYVWIHVAVLLARTLTATNDAAALLNIAMLGADVAICGAWVWLIRRGGEALPPKTHLTEAEEAWFQQRMRALADVSSRAAER